MIELTIKFRPMQKETHELMINVWLNENKNPIEAYSRLISAAVMAGAMVEMMPDQIADQVKKFMPYAHLAIKEHPELFGPMLTREN